jgi:hypothetical protein
MADLFTQEGEPENVIDFSVMASREPSVTIKPRTKTAAMCRHINIVIDEKLRQIECGSCGAILDPIEAMIQIMPLVNQRHEERQEWEVTRLKRHVEDLEHRLKIRQWYDLTKYLSPEERSMTGQELMMHHVKHGHPPDKVRLTRNHFECYCGCGWSRALDPEFEQRVLAAQRAQKTREKMAVVYGEEHE